MNRKQINTKLLKVFKGLLDHIRTLENHAKFKEYKNKGGLTNHFATKTFFAGGCIVNMFKDQDVNDYDLYLTDEKLAQSISNYFYSIRW